MSHSKKKSNEESDLEEIRKGFEMFDTNGTGLVNPSEIKEAMESMNMQEKNPFIFEIISSLSSSDEFQNKEGISIDDLVNYVYEKVNDNESNLGLRQLFDALKEPGSNTISMHTFMKLAQDYEEDDFSGNELTYLLEKTQLGGDELTFEEFCTIMKGGMSSASVKSEEPDYDKKKINKIDNNISEEIKEIKEINESSKKDDDNINNGNNYLINDENKDNVNYKENDNEISIKEKKNNNNEVIIDNNNNDINKNQIKDVININKPENKIEENNNEFSIKKNECDNITEKDLNVISPIPQVKVDEESIQKDEEKFEPEIKQIIIEQKINIQEEKPKLEEKPLVEEKHEIVTEEIKLEEKPKEIENKIEIEIQKPKEEETPKEIVKPGRFRRWSKMAEKPKVEDKPKEEEKIEAKVEHTTKKGYLTYNANNNKISEVETSEIKEEKPVKKYNRFRRFNINKDNNDNNNNNINNDIKNSNNKPEVDKKEIVEEKTTVTRKVYKTRRPYNANNNVEIKKEEKIETNNEKKETEIPRRYHRRYRDNKSSTNSGV